MYLIGAVATAIYGFIYFGMLNTLVPALMFLTIMLSWVPHDMMYGPQAALIAECFTPRLRYSGSSIDCIKWVWLVTEPADGRALKLQPRLHMSPFDET